MIPGLLRTSLYVITACLISKGAASQNCEFRDTSLYLHFGTDRNPEELRMSFLKEYTYVDRECPDDGQYTYATETSGCFNDDWHRITEDHTPGDRNGKFLLVNAAYRPGPFFISYPGNLEPNAQYEFSVWLMNVCRTNSGCPPLTPAINITIETETGRKLAEFNTGNLNRRAAPGWSLYSGMFNTGSNPGRLILIMKDINRGGCGNDFALDDIMIRRCYPLNVTPAPPMEKPPLKRETPVAKPVQADPPDNPSLKKRDIKPTPVITETEEKLPAAKTVLNAKNTGTSTPLPLLKRENPVVSRIKTKACTLQIELYDNGQIDGDTVSIFHNNVLVADKVGLTASPVKLQLQVSASAPHHELTMVAENLGSIPPNTSLMVVTGAGKRQEVFISSSETSNARVLIDLEQ